LFLNSLCYVSDDSIEDVLHAVDDSVIDKTESCGCETSYKQGKYEDEETGENSLRLVIVLSAIAGLNLLVVLEWS
jgi:hypothetical protein